VRLASELNRKMFSTKENVLIGYVIAGYPTEDSCLDIIKRCDDAKLDIFEIGLPSKNPYNDGEVIRKAHNIVSKRDEYGIEYFKKIRSLTSKPIWIMAYYEDLISTKKHIEYATAGVVDAFVIPNISFEERVELKKNMETYNVDVLGFTNPSMDDAEMNKNFDSFDIVYEQLYSGQTGSRNSSDEYSYMLELSKKKSSLIKIAGFGINAKEKSLKLINEGYDGIIIGTEMVRKLNVSVDTMVDFIDEVGDHIKK